MSLVDQQVLGGDKEGMLEIVAEPVGDRFEEGCGSDVGLLLRGIGSTGCERNGYLVARIFRGLFNGGAAGQDDQIR